MGFISSFFYVNDPNVARIVRRFGKPVRVTQTPGWKFKIPFIEKLEPEPVFLAERSLTITMEKPRTLDDTYVESLPIIMHLVVTDPMTFHYKGIESVQKIIGQIVESEVKSFVSQHNLKDLFQMRNEMGTLLQKTLGHKTETGDATRTLEQVLKEDFGVRIKNILVEDIHVDQKISDASNNKMTAQLNYEAKVITAKADGEAAAIRRDTNLKGLAHTYNDLVREGMDKKEAKDFIFGSIEAETMRHIGESGNMVVAMGKGKNKDTIQAALTKQLNDQDKKEKKPFEPPKPE